MEVQIETSGSNGQVAAKMEQIAITGGYTEISRAASLNEAVRIAAEISLPGDVVILNPGCASFDMFKDFEDRGAQFRDCFRQLAS